MMYTSHRLRAQEKKVAKKLIFSGIFFLGGILFIVFAGLPLLAKLAVGLSLIKGETKTANESRNNPIFAPVIDSLPSATNSGTISISGYSDKEREIILSVNGEEQEQNMTDDEGKFKFRAVKITPGENKISLKAKYKDQTSESAEFSIAYKKDPPKLEISEPSDGQTIHNDANITIKGVTDPGSKISINDRLVIVERDGNFSFPESLHDGENEFKITATDDAGNTNEDDIKINYSS